MRKSKTSLISDFFSPKPDYRKYSLFAYVFWSIGLLLVGIGLAIVQLNGGIINGGFESSGVVTLSIFGFAFFLGIVGITFSFIPYYYGKKARDFIKERMTNEIVSTRLSVSEAIGGEAIDDCEMIVFAGFTPNPILKHEPRFWRDDFKKDYSTNFVVTAFACSEKQLYAVQQFSCFDNLNAHKQTVDSFDYESIIALDRHSVEFEYRDCRNRVKKGEFSLLVLQSQKTNYIIPIEYRDPMDSESDRTFKKEEYDLRVLIASFK